MEGEGCPMNYLEGLVASGWGHENWSWGLAAIEALKSHEKDQEVPGGVQEPSSEDLHVLEVAQEHFLEDPQ